MLSPRLQQGVAKCWGKCINTLQEGGGPGRGRKGTSVLVSEERDQDWEIDYVFVRSKLRVEKHMGEQSELRPVGTAAFWVVSGQPSCLCPYLV